MELPHHDDEMFDVGYYAGLYSGRTKNHRLLFIAKNCLSEDLRLESLRIAYNEVKIGLDLQSFENVVKTIDGRLGPEYGLDSVWIKQVKDTIDKGKDRLDNTRRYICERVDVTKKFKYTAYMEYGDFHCDIGEFGDVREMYGICKDNCSGPEDVLGVLLKEIILYIECKWFHLLPKYVEDALRAHEVDMITLTKISCVTGLAHLNAMCFKRAAIEFVVVGPELLESGYSDVIAPQDVAIYGGLCSLACFDREELKNYVIDNATFRNFLEYVPEVRDLILDFYSRKYASCLKCLDNLKAKLLLDIYLHDHVETLYSEILDKAIIQYTYPFVSVNLRMMAGALGFSTDVSGLEKKLISLINDEKLEWRRRGDSLKKVLYMGQRYANLPPQYPNLTPPDADADGDG